MIVEKPFKKVAPHSFAASLPDKFILPGDTVGQRLLKEYGAIFIARGGAVPPNTVIFRNETEVAAFQACLSKSKENIGGYTVELQTIALENLKSAILEAAQNNLTITPRGADAAERNYSDTVDLWASRVNPGLTHWVGEGKLNESKASKIRSLSPFEQVTEIFKLESKKMFFSKDLSKSIVYSVAPPGTSQHLSLLALDICEHENEKTRRILANHHWFQTVVSDLPHFTFLGVPESQLSNFGLKKVSVKNRRYWLPNL